MILRQIACFIGLIFFSFGGLFLGSVIFPIVSLFSSDKKICKQNCSELVHKSWYILVKYLVLTKVIGLKYDEEISNIKNRIIVASHPSYIDILLLIALIPNSLCVVKKSILSNFFMKYVAKSLYIPNDDSVDDFLKKSQSALDEGYNIIIFPTGGRVQDGEDVHIHKGAAKLAIVSNVPIVPVKITTTEPFMPKNKPILYVGQKPVIFDLKIQEEISVSNCFSQDLSEIAIRNKICAIIKEKI